MYGLLEEAYILKLTKKSKRSLKKNFQDLIRKCLPVDVLPDKVDILFGDESRVGQKGIITRNWFKRGTRPRVIRQQQHISTYIFGAVCPEKDYGMAMIFSECDTEVMQMFLNEVSVRIPFGRHAVLILDQASWHTTENLKCPLNISLLHLPPYSPELNPVEQVWHFLKQYFLSNRTFKDWDDIANACVKAWNAFVSEPLRIKSLCSRKWASVRV